LNFFKKIKKIIRTNKYFYARDVHYFKKKKIFYGESLNSIFKTKIEDQNPLLISRLGTVESEIVKFFLLNKNMNFPIRHKTELKEMAGVFPTDDKNVKRFTEIYIDSLKYVDLLAVRSIKEERAFWKNEKTILKHTKCNSDLVSIGDFDAFFHDLPWTNSLEGKKILVIHPFSNSIKKQIQSGVVFSGKFSLPKCEINVLRPVQSQGNMSTKCGFDSWYDALTDMKMQIKELDFDIALIGAGAYGLPLGAYCKYLGKKAIHLGGSLQLYFKIIGKRWNDLDSFKSIIDQSWIKPDDSEIPDGFEKVENRPYW